MPGGVCGLWHVSKLLANVVYVSLGPARPTRSLARGMELLCNASFSELRPRSGRTPVHRRMSLTEFHVAAPLLTRVVSRNQIYGSIAGANIRRPRL